MQPRSPWKGKANPSFFCNHRSGRKLLIVIAFAKRSKTDVFYRLIVINALLKPTSFTPLSRYLGITFVKILFHFSRSIQGMCLESLKEALLSIVSMYLLLKAHVNLYKQLKVRSEGYWFNFEWYNEVLILYSETSWAAGKLIFCPTLTVLLIALEISSAWTEGWWRQIPFQQSIVYHLWVVIFRTS